MLENVSYKTDRDSYDPLLFNETLSYGGTENEDDSAAGYPSIVTVTTEEVVLVSGAIILWFACVVLFVNKWGKIRMMEPYHPDYHSSDYPSSKKQSIRVDLSDEVQEDGTVADEIALELLRRTRIRQNSMFAFESSKPRSFDQVTPRRYKSAEDILSLVVHVEELQEVQELQEDESCCSSSYEVDHLQSDPKQSPV